MQALAHTGKASEDPCVRCMLQDEIAEMRRKFKIMGHQIEQLKEEISAKDLALVKEHFDHMKVCNRLQQASRDRDKAPCCSSFSV